MLLRALEPLLPFLPFSSSASDSGALVSMFSPPTFLLPLFLALPAVGVAVEAAAAVGVETAGADFPRLFEGVVAGEGAADSLFFLLLRGWSRMLLRSRSARETEGALHLPPRSFLISFTWNFHLV